MNKLTKLLREYFNEEITDARIVNTDPVIIEYKVKLDPVYYYLLKEIKESCLIMFDVEFNE